MNQINLWFDKIKNRYYLDEVMECTNCKQKIIDIIRVVVMWNKKESWLSYYCHDCFAAIKGHSLVREELLAIVDAPPKTATPVLISPPQLVKAQDISVFDVGKIQSTHTTDRTKNASHNAIKESDIKVGYIGNPDYSFIEEKDKTITSQKQAGKLLEGLQE